MTWFEDSGARLSACGLYRYSLWRRWAGGKTVNFIMLNPSTADAQRNDPTVERCCRRARQLGFAGIVITNLFAWRATQPRELRRALARGVDVIGPENDEAIVDAAAGSMFCLCAWGNHGSLLERDRGVMRLLGRFQTMALETTEEAQPAHPLYLPYSLQPFAWPLDGDDRRVSPAL